MRSRWAIAVGALGLLGLLPVAGGAQPAVGTPDTTVGPLISGTGSYLGGTYAWTDYAYDDTGANTDTSPGGDATYPPSLPEGNAADLIQLQLTLTGDDRLTIRAVLQTLLDPGVPVVRVGLGADTVTLGSADVLTNSLEATVPAPSGDSISVTASAGVGATVHDLAFVRAEDVCTMPAAGQPASCVPNPDNRVAQDHRQADVLAGKRPPEEARATVDLRKLRAGVTELAGVDTRGFHSLLYHSDLNLGEGIRSSGSGARSRALPHEIYAGPYQPYVVRLPHAPAGPLPAIVYLHGRSGNHLQAFVNNFTNFDPAAIVVGVLGRGFEVGYGGNDWSGVIEPEGAYGEQDVLDVLDDLGARGLLDPERVVIGGISMGGVGAFHVAEMHPDRFAGVLPIVGGDAGIAPANWWPDLIENLSNMPLRMANGAIDPLAHLGSQMTPALLQGLRTVDIRAWEALRRHHEWQAGLVDCVWTELLAKPRVVDPARVIYSVNPAYEVANPATGLTRTHTGAYWVSGLRLRPDSLDRSVTSPATSRIDVTSLARPDRTVIATPLAGAGQNLTAGADYCGANAAVRTNDAWEMNGVALAPGPAQPTSNGLTVSVSGLTAAILDLARMRISVEAPVLVSVTGDGPGALTLRGPWPAGGRVVITRDGAPFATVDVTGGAVTVADDFLGRHNYTLTPTNP